MRSTLQPLTLIRIYVQIPATALCSVIMLRRSLSRLQWFSIVLLSLGVGVVQLASSAADKRYHVHVHVHSADTARPVSNASDGLALPPPAHGETPVAVAAAAAAAASATRMALVVAKRASEAAVAHTVASIEEEKHSSTAGSDGQMNQLLGLVASVLACFSSGFSGVYFEKVLKKRPAPLTVTATAPSSAIPASTSPIAVGAACGASPQAQAQARACAERKMGLWIRNIQLSLFSLLVGSAIYLAASPAPLRAILAPRETFLVGFTPIVYALVGIQVAGGLLAAVVIQYADNIAKSFSASLSILLSFAASVYLFGYRLNSGIVAGSAIVMGATWLFSEWPSPLLFAVSLFSARPHDGTSNLTGGTGVPQASVVSSARQAR